MTTTVTFTINWTLAIAVYAAVVSTVVVIWDIVKWNLSAPRLRINAVPNMEVMPGLGAVYAGLAHQCFVSVEVVNVGNKKTTLTHLFGRYYKSRPQRVSRRKPTRLFAVLNPGPGPGLPFELEAGARWIGSIDQSPELEELSRSGLLFVGVYHTMSKRATEQRLVIQLSAE